MPDKILTVDDCRLDRELTSMMLRKAGYDVLALAGAEGVLETVEHEHPDLILLDIMMPDIDGRQLLSALRAKWSQVELPVIMLTAKSEAEDVVEALNLGANDFIAKPVDFKVAQKRVETHLTIAKLSRKLSELHRLEAIGGMVVTYNHEINNPLTIALGNLQLLRKHYPGEARFGEVIASLERIAGVVRSLQDLLERSQLDLDSYWKSVKMVRLGG